MAWKRDVFYPACHDAAFRQDCKICGDIFWDLEITVTGDGRVEKIEKMRAVIDCPKKSDSEKVALEELALASVSSIVFPSPLRDMCVACRFGQVTRC